MPLNAGEIDSQRNSSRFDHLPKGKVNLNLNMNMNETYGNTILEGNPNIREMSFSDPKSHRNVWH
jgi:hypothetical protein